MSGDKKPPARPSPAWPLRTDRSLDPDVDEPKTDPGFRVTAEYMWRKMEESQQAIESKHEKSLVKHDNKLTIRSVAVAIGAVAAGVFAGVSWMDNRVAAQTDAGMTAVKAEAKAIDARVTTLEKRFDRFDQKMDLMLDAQRVPEWKRPPPLDAGTPERNHK